MKKSLVLALLLMSAKIASAQWAFDASHSNLSFSVQHLMISEATGKFKKFDVKMTSKNDDFSGSEVELTIDPASVNTEDEKRDGHLKSADFFDVAKYPQITFKSKSFTKVSDKKYKVAGDLTMHGVTKPVELDVDYKGTVKSPFGATVAAFKISGVINRTEFGLVWNKTLESGGLLVGEKVNLTADIELTKKG
jgi:polyisoprenoid-binding protein YceI